MYTVVLMKTDKSSSLPEETKTLAHASMDYTGNLVVEHGQIKANVH